jgi:glycerol uptake facilitator protein
VAIGISFGANAGYAINPARDFGPRMLALVAGWGDVAFPGDYGNVNTYFWIPIVGPLLGAVIGALIYDLFIHDVLTARGEMAEAVDVRGETVEDERSGRIERAGRTVEDERTAGAETHGRSVREERRPPGPER